MSQIYRDMKSPGVEGVGRIPSHWSVQRIKHLVETPVTDGPHETPEFLDEGVPFVSAEAISEGRINFDKIRGFISSDDHVRFSKKYLPKRNDIFVVKSGASTGTTAIVDTDTEFNIWSPLAAIRCSHDHDPRFVLYAIRSRNFQEAIQLGWNFGTQQNISMGVLQNLWICSPPLPEQRIIAAFLDRETGKIDGLIEEQRRLIALLKEKRQAVIFHAVTKGLDPTISMKDSGVEWLGDIPADWTASPLKYLVTFRSGGTPDKSNLDYWDGDVPWVSARDLKNETVQDSNLHISEHALSTGAASLVAKGSVIVLVRGMTLAHTFPVCIVAQPMAINQDLKALNSNSSISNEYLALALRGLSDVSLARVDEAGHGTKALRMEAWTSMHIPVPPEADQAAIQRFVSRETAKIDALTSEAKKAIGLLQERRNALISAAVTGKIDVRGGIPKAMDAA